MKLLGPQCLSCLLVSCIALTVSAGAAEEAKLLGPRLVVESAQVDLGERPVTEDSKHEFRIWNRGDQSLVLEVLDKSCGCMRDPLSKQVVSPDDYATVEIGYTAGSARQSGTRTYTVVLGTNDLKQPELSLILKMDLRAALSVDPLVLDFGSLPRDKPASSVLTVYSDNKDAKVWIEAYDSRYLKISPSDTSLDSGPEHDLGKHQFSIELDTLRAPATISTKLVVKTDVGAYSHVDVPIRGRIASPIKAEPERLLMGLLKPGVTASQTVTLTFSPQETEPPAGVHTESELFSVDLRKADAPNTVELQVSVTPSAPGATLSDTIWIQDASGRILQTVDVRGVVSSE